MATTFDVLSLGVQADIDAVEGNTVTEGAASLEGLTVGSAGDPLFTAIQTLSPGSTGYAGGSHATAYENDEQADTFSIDGDTDQVFDMGMVYNVTLTYADGSTATIEALVVQDTDGNTYLVPHLGYSSDQAALEAAPIQSIALGTAIHFSGSEGYMIEADRYDASFAEPEDDFAAPDNDVTFVGGADVPSASGEFELDGSGDYGVIADSPAYDLDSATVAMNFTLDSLASLTGLFGKDANGNAVGDFSVWVETDGSVVVRWQDDTTDYYLSSDAGAVTTGTEHSVLVSLDNDTGTVELHVDGALEDSLSTPGVTLDGNENPWVVGGRGWGSTRGTSDNVINELDGTINSFAIYEGAYTPAEIAAPAGEDHIHGDAGADSLSGGADADTFHLYDFFDDDTIIGGEGGGEGGGDDDKIDAGGVSMPLTVIYTGAESGTISDGASTLTFSEIETVETGSDDDVIDATGAGVAGVKVYSGFGDDTVTGSAGDDWISTNHGNDVVQAGAGADTIDTDFGDDSAWAGDGDDTVWTGFGDDAVYGDGGGDYIYGGYGSDTIYGGEGDDEIGVGRDDDTAYGGGGSDQFVFEHDMGSNIIVGGEIGTDADIRDFTSLYNAPISVAFSGDEAGTATDPYGDIALSEIEVIWGSDFDDIVDAALDGTRIEMQGFAGADTLTGGSGDDMIAGGPGDDVLSGNLGDDTFVFEGGFGDDTVTGGEKGEVVGDTLDATALKDGVKVVFTKTGAGELTDNTNSVTVSEIENLALGSGGDLVSAGADEDEDEDEDGVGVDAGDDALSGGADYDTIYGGAGADTIIGGAGGDFVYGEEGDDVVYCGDDLDVIFSGQGNDTHHGVGGDGGDDIIVVNDADASTKAVAGGKTGETSGDSLILSGDGSNSTAVEVAFTGDEAGTFDDGTNSGTFAEIERLTTSSGDDTVDASAATAGTDIASGSGADSVVGGAGDDVVTGGYGYDTFALSGSHGADIITDFDLTDDDGDGFTNDQLDLTKLTDSDGNPVNIWDVVVSDTAGDGSGDAILTFPNGESLTLTGVDPAGLAAATMTSMGIPCLAAGTLIDTPDGGRLVEQFCPGDKVMTKGGGAQPVVRTGSRRLDAAALAAQPHLRPVRIRPGALGNWRDLLVSPLHRIALGPAGAPTGLAPGPLARGRQRRAVPSCPGPQRGHLCPPAPA